MYADWKGWLLLVLLLWAGGCSGDGSSQITDPNGNGPPPPPPPPITWSLISSPVLAPSDSGWDHTWVATSAVIRRGETFHMWYGGSGSTASNTLSDPIAIGYATSEDGVIWQRVGNEPVMAPRPEEWDHNHIQRPAVLLDGDTLRMWYGGGRNPGDHDIGYATSVDGIHWERRPGPVLLRGPTGEWNSSFASPGTVLKEDGLFRMWFYAGVGLIGSGNWGPSSRISIGYATSPDGVEWTLYDDPATTEAPYRFSDPVLTPTENRWDHNVVFSPSVIRVDSGYEMWYTGHDGRIPLGQIGHATSSDGIHWTKSEWSPFLGGVRGYTPVFPSVIPVGGEYRLWFTDWITHGASVYLAVGTPQGG